MKHSFARLKVSLLSFSLCVVCITLSAIVYHTAHVSFSSLEQSTLFLGDEAHLMDEMAQSWRDKQSLRIDQGESELPNQNVDIRHDRSSVPKGKLLAKYSMLASPSKSIASSPKKSAAVQTVASAVHQAKPKKMRTRDHAASASEHAEANSLVHFAGNLAQEIVRR
jgi:hypothetical protein